MRRRTYIASLGTAVGIGSVPVVNASDSMLGADEVGLTDKIRQLHRDGQHDRAARLLDRNDIPHSRGESVDTGTENIGRDTLGGRRSESESTHDSGMWYRGGDVYSAWGSSTLRGNSGIARTAHFIDDGVGITYDTAVWAAEEATEDGVYLSNDRESIEFEEYDPNEGVCAKSSNIKTSAMEDTDNYVYIETDLVRLQDANVPVYYDYDHTWSNTRAGDLDLGLDFPGLDIGLPSLSSVAWDEREATYPD